VKYVNFLEISTLNIASEHERLNEQTVRLFGLAPEKAMQGLAIDDDLSRHDDAEFSG
jgi:hypothetical protein